MYLFIVDMPRKLKWAILLLMDIFWVPVALLVAFVLHNNSLGVMDFPLVNRFAAFSLMGTSALLSIVTGSYRIQLKSYETRAVGLTALQTLGLGAFAYMLDRVANYSSEFSVFIIFMLSYFLLAVASRVIMLQVLLAIHRIARPQKKVLIYGAGATGRQLAAALRTNEDIQPVGYVDDNQLLHGNFVQGLKVHSPHSLADLIKKKRVKSVLLAMPSKDRASILILSRRLEKLGITVQALPSFAQLAQGESLFDKIETVAPGQFLGRSALDADIAVGAQVYAARTVLISGAGGSIGSELSRQVLATKPAKLILFENNEFALYKIHKEALALKEGTNVLIEAVLGSVTDTKLVNRVFKQHNVDVVLHAAAYKHVPLVEDNVQVGVTNNVYGTLTLAKAAKHNKVERFILVSTDKAVRPTNVMGATKRISEIIVQRMAAKISAQGGTTIFSMVRFGNVLGSSGSVVPLFQEQISQGGPVTITHEEVTRYFMTISEAARLVLLAGSLGNGGEVFVLDMGTPVKIIDLAKQMVNAAGLTIRNSENPDGDIEVIVTGLRPGEKLHEELMIGEANFSRIHPKIFRSLDEGIGSITLDEIERIIGNALKVDDTGILKDAIDALVTDSNSVFEFPKLVQSNATP